MTPHAKRDRKFVVLEATAPPKGTTEYVDQVTAFADPAFEFLFLSARTAFRRADVFHVHWPELIVRGRNTPATIVRCLGLYALLLLMRLRKTAIVRTLHNLQPHEPGSILERWVVGRLERQTDLFVRINPLTPVPHGPCVTIPHGHYRNCYASHPKSPAVAGRIAFVGLIRPYKGVEQLISAFRATRTPGLSLRIAGKPTDAMRAVVAGATESDPRISVRFGYLPDKDFVSEISAAELICLPYENVHNSGALLAALSLNRPVLVKSTPTTRTLAEEVGPGWVHFFDDRITPNDIDHAIEVVRESPRTESPTLVARDWPTIGAKYSAAFRQAMRVAGQKPKPARVSIL